MIQNLVDFYKSLDLNDQMSQRGLDMAIKQINGGLLDFAFAPKRTKARRREMHLKVFNIFIYSFIHLL